MTRKSPSLDIVFDRDKRSGEFSDRRRMPRLSLSEEQFRLKTNGKIFSVTDLSSVGMALRIIERNDHAHFSMGSQIEGVLNLRRVKFPITGSVKHALPDLIGIEFDALDPAARKLLENFLDPVALGQELRPLPSSECSHWYHGPSGTDLMLWRAMDGSFTRMALYFLGTFVHWESATGLVTGRSAVGGDLPEERGVVRLETLLLSPDASPDSGKLNIAKTLLLSSNLPQDLQKWCVRQLGFN